MASQKPTGKTTRYEGMDLLRGLAAFAVVVIHTPAAVDDPVKTFLLTVLPPANAVFAMMAGFLMADGLARAPAKFKDWMVGRAGRLLMPYTVWTVVYVLLNVVFDAARGQPSNFVTADWLFWGNVIFCGGGGIQLWFLIMLFYAQVLLFFGLSDGAHASQWVRKTVLILLTVSALAGYPVIAPQGTTEGCVDAFLFMVGYVGLGAAFQNFKNIFDRPSKWLVRGTAVGLFGVIVVGLCRQSGFSWVNYGIGILCVSLWMAWALVFPFDNIGPAIRSVAHHSMGIYLIHIVFTTLIPLGLSGGGLEKDGDCWTVIIAPMAFLASWLTSALLSRNQIGFRLING